MNGVRVDPNLRRIVAQGGSLWQDVDFEALTGTVALSDRQDL
jgi:hypothetical protein